MQATDIVLRYHAAIEQSDWDTVNTLLADDFVFRVPALPALSKGAYVSSVRALQAAFPDLRFNLRIVAENGLSVQGITQMTGRHSGLLIPPFTDQFMTILPTGKQITLAEETCHYTLANGRIVRQDVEGHPDGSWPGIFKQLGVEYPYPLPDYANT